jgi:dsRNA-specific ribonuclease
VLGLAIAEWLYRREDSSEGELAQRLNALVSRATCAVIAQEIGLPDHAAKFTVRVKVHKVGEAEATAGSKQDAETEAARLFMKRFG